MSDSTIDRLAEDISHRDVPQLRYIVGVVCGLFLLSAPIFISSYHLFILGSICFLATFTVTWDFFTGNTGYFNFAHMVIIGVAGYSSALLNGELGISLFVTIPLATLIAGLFGTLVIAGPSLRLSGIYFVALTFILPVYAQDIVVLFSDITGGLPGYLYVKPLGPVLAGRLPIAINGELLMYYVAAVIFLLSLSGFVILSKSQLGIVLRGISQDELLLSSIGLNPTRFKIAGFAITALVTGFAGAVWTHYLVTLTPATQLSIGNMVDIVIAATIGGIGTIVGPALGMFLIQIVDNGIVILEDVVGQPFGIRLVDYRRAFTLIVALLFFYLYPGGLYPALRKKFSQLTDRSTEDES